MSSAYQVSKLMVRRTFAKSLCAGAAGMWIGGGTLSAFSSEKIPSASRLPRWRGFNLLEKFISRPGGDPPFRQTDFQIIQDWGFDFVRLPMSYQCWSKPDPAVWLEMDEFQLKHLDQALTFGVKRGIHVNMNLHRAPGYCVNPPGEPLDLWNDARALDAAAHHWSALARRWKGVSNKELSFDLLNEPPDISAEKYVKVIRHLVEAIRSVDPERLIIADGLRWGRDPVEGLIGLGIGQSTRGYDPMRVSHHQANWVAGADKWTAPEWPLREGDKPVWNKDRLRRERIAPWRSLENRGVGVHVGEWGAHNRTPHKVALLWMQDQLELWKEAGWGWALWNLRGSFGVLDSGRTDVVYEDFRGHKLDRRMLELLQYY